MWAVVSLFKHCSAVQPQRKRNRLTEVRTPATGCVLCIWVRRECMFGVAQGQLATKIHFGNVLKALKQAVCLGHMLIDLSGVLFTPKPIYLFKWMVLLTVCTSVHRYSCTPTTHTGGWPCLISVTLFNLWSQFTGLGFQLLSFLWRSSLKAGLICA